MDKLQGALNTIQAVQGISGRHNVKVRKKEDMTAKSKKYQAFAQAAYKDSEENVKGYEFYGKMAKTYAKLNANEQAKVKAVEFFRSLHAAGTPAYVTNHYRQQNGRVYSQYLKPDKQPKFSPYC